MKKFFLPVAFFALAISAQAQEAQEEIVEVVPSSKYKAANYNKWSVEVNGGGNNAIYNWNNKSSDAKFLGLWHADLGVRYMFNTKFGLKADAGYDRITNRDDSPEFETTQWRFGLQGVINLGRVLSFEDWTKSFSLLFHGGPAYSIFQNDNIPEDDEMFSVMAGLTAQFKLSEKFALTLDATGINNFGMKYTWNGLSRNAEYLTVTTVIPSQVVNGETIPGQTVTSQVANPATNYTRHLNPLLNVSLGLTYYFGNKQQHADWYLEEDLSQRIDNIEEMLKDDDNDGVPNYLDQEPNSAPDAVVDTKGRTIDANGNGVPDVIEQYIKDNYPAAGNAGVLSDSNILKQLIDSGIINVYFDYDKSVPFDASIGGVDFVVEYLKMNPNASVEILGYADPAGGASYNQALSQRRADAVKQIIVGKGINASRLNAKGQGIDGQFKGSAVSAHQLARRVIFKIK
ncbi:OmpA family protein [Moheibacter sediminis]|uniref:OmpA-OmpF porin, OOP family n=1 Tax=Moheibacter sediminis TaxID=1434700 RepID=A0A1W1YH87_9FLAO|nr:OmpA family protein [Moheibacter sediminis]SMC35590.1 OmpA-OmpF porin, OOP family [Moheibacter sediminis]